jgi:large subunit ribosomal protein L35
MAKVKMKTRRAAAKRFKVTATGKILRMPGARSHNRTKKAKRTTRAFDKMVEVAPSDRHRFKRLLPYGLS